MLLCTDDGVMALHMVQADHGETTARPRHQAVMPCKAVTPVTKLSAMRQ